MASVQLPQSYFLHDLTHENLLKYNQSSSTMNGDENKGDDDMDETNPRSSSNSTASNISGRSASLSTSSAVRQQQQTNRRRAFFRDDVIISSDSKDHSSPIECNQQNSQRANATRDVTSDERSLALVSQHDDHNNNNNHHDDHDLHHQQQHSEDNQTSRPFKRKVVSFGTMPCEKKVADGE